MADVKISELPAASALVAGDLFPAVQDDGGLVTRKATAAQIATHALGSVPGLSAVSSVADTDELLVNQSGVARKATAAQMGDYVRSLAGMVRQVVESNTTTGASVTGTTWTDTGQSVTITPTSASSKVLILAHLPLFLSRDTGTINSAAGGSRLVRGSTAIVQYAVYQHLVSITGLSGVTEFLHGVVVPFMFLDSPATTSATTYKTQMRGDIADDFVASMTFGDSRASIVALEIAA
jgi:hypothetical protein